MSSQDGVAITAIERIEALEALPELTRELVDPERQNNGKGGDGGDGDGDSDGEESDASSSSSSSSSSETDLRNLEREAELLEEQMQKQRDERGEEAKVPWSRAARLLLARETAAAADGQQQSSGGSKAAAAAATPASPVNLFDYSSRAVEPLRTSMPPWSSSSSSDEDDGSSGGEGGEEGEKRGGRRGNPGRRRRRQCDDGSWPFALFPSPDGSPLLVLEVALGTTGRGGGEVELDVRARHARVFLSGSLLCARLPARVDPSRAAARRSLASGRLVVAMPLADPAEELEEACIREWGGERGGGGGGGRGREVRGGGGGRAAAGRAVSAAAVVTGENEDSDGEGSVSPPPL